VSAPGTHKHPHQLQGKHRYSLALFNTVSCRVKPEHVVNEKDLERTLRIDARYNRNYQEESCGKKKAITLVQRNIHGWTHICCLLGLIFTLDEGLFAPLGGLCNLLNLVTSRCGPCLHAWRVLLTRNSSSVTTDKISWPRQKNHNVASMINRERYGILESKIHEQARKQASKQTHGGTTGLHHSSQFGISDVTRHTYSA
jgi:hypothetical protein